MEIRVTDFGWTYGRTDREVAKNAIWLNYQLSSRTTFFQCAVFCVKMTVTFDLRKVESFNLCMLTLQ